ncbi:MAG: TetR/AcrR family transcriptional regulator [Armatimonadota bacterium]|nr:TetR/AcrR family transcriptional regulator [Armatimonadota bacterium]MDR7533238.1 TetR/AcrR family transcriptional regulator [Armatimonadota bacterium]MDR7536969.1 TetR/AcrR family transcriptional regulator [Armatimonadota bacterium]
MPATPPHVRPVRRRRNPAATREAILDAAERLFAAKGYEGTSLGEIGRAARVSRGTPGYFYGSKERLYRAVLERALTAAREVLTQARARAATAGGAPEALLREAIGSYLAFLAARPTFVRLIEWETLSGARFLGASPAHIGGLREALAVTQEELARGALRSVDPAHLLLSVMGLCWFPFAHADSLTRSLKLDPRTPAFLAARRAHIVDLLLYGLLPRS